MRADESFSVVCAATAVGRVNIALIKYWGKKECEDGENVQCIGPPHFGCGTFGVGCNNPINDSISITLDNEMLRTETTVQLCAQSTSAPAARDQMIFNGEPKEITPRYRRILRVVRHFLSLRGSAYASEESFFFRIRTENFFPTACGLASSASGASAFAGAIAQLWDKLAPNDPGSLPHPTVLARFASGSGCRSVCDGFVHWHAEGEEPSRPCAVTIAGPNHWPALGIFCIVFPTPESMCGQAKAVSSASGMKLSMLTSPRLCGENLSAWLETKRKRISTLTSAIRKRNFEELASITMAESDDLHAVCATASPALTYMNAFSQAMIDFVKEYNALVAGDARMAYTFDAGPNAFLLCERQTCQQLYAMLRLLFPGTADRDCHMKNSQEIDLAPQAAFAPSIEALLKAFCVRVQKVHESVCGPSANGKSCALHSLYFAVPGNGASL